MPKYAVLFIVIVHLCAIILQTSLLQKKDLVIIMMLQPAFSDINCIFFNLLLIYVYCYFCYKDEFGKVLLLLTLDIKCTTNCQFNNSNNNYYYCIVFFIIGLLLYYNVNYEVQSLM